MKYQMQDMLTFRYLAAKLRRINTRQVITLADHIGPLEIVVDSDALLIRREFYKGDPWLVLKDGEIRLYESREDYEIGNINASEVIIE